MHKVLLSMATALMFTTTASAGFNVVDEDVAGAHYGNAQHSVFKQAMEGSSADISPEDRELITRSARTKIDGRYYFRVRGAPLGRLNVKKFVQNFSGSATVLPDAKFKADEMQTSLAVGLNMSNSISLDAEMIIMESATFTKAVTLKSTAVPLGAAGNLSGRIKPRMYLVNGDYSFEPLQVTLAGSTIMPYATVGVGLGQINPSKMSFSNGAVVVSNASEKKRLGFSVGFGWKARATNDLSLDLGYRLHYLGQGRLAQIGGTTNTVDAERVIAHGLFLGGAFHF